MEDNLTFAWSAGSGSPSAFDNDGNPRLGWQFSPKGRARLNHDHSLIIECGAFVGEGVGGWIGQSLTGAQSGTLVVNVVPEGLGQAGTILSLANEDGIILSQHQSSLRATYTLGGTSATVEAPVPQPVGPIAVALVITAGEIELYLNGERKGVSETGPKALALENPKLSLGNLNDAVAARWAGTIEGIAIYAHALDGAAVRALSETYTAQREARVAVDQLQVRARLAGKSTLLTPRDLAPYTQGLCVYQYEVIEVLEGAYAEPTLHVAHWMVLDNTLLPFSKAEIGSEHQLTLELLDENPQLASENLSDDIVEDFSLPYFFDAGGRSTACKAPGN